MQNDIRRGGTYAIAAAAAFSLTGVCVKTAIAKSPNEVVVFFRCAVSFLALLPWVLHARGAGWRTKRLGGHLSRAAFGLLSMYAFFYSIAQLPLAEAMILTYSTPLWIPFLAWFVLHERPPSRAIGGSLLGLVGILLIVKPDVAATASWLPGLIGAASGLLAGCAMVTIRKLSDTEPPQRIVFYFVALGTLISSVPLLRAWVTPDPVTLLFLIGSGLTATAGQLYLTKAYASAPAALIGPFTYITVVFSGLLAWALWGEQPDLFSVFGMLLVVLTCVLMSWTGRGKAAGN